MLTILSFAFLSTYSIASTKQLPLCEQFLNENGKTTPEFFACAKKNAELGNADSQYQLGMMYSRGEQTTDDKQQAFYWIQKGAEQGHAEAQYTVGLFYKTGWGVMQDDQQAFYWYQKAASQEHYSAMLALFTFYNEGIVIEKDEEQAEYWGLKALEQGPTERTEVNNIFVYTYFPD